MSGPLPWQLEVQAQPRGAGAGPSRRTRFRVARARRWLAAALVAAAAWILVGAALPRPAVTGVPMLVTTHDLASGALVGPDDVEVQVRPPANAAIQVLADPREVVGQRLAGPLLAGEELTPARLQGPALLAGAPTGTVAMSLPLADSGLLATLHPGDRVIVYAAGAPSAIGDATVLVVSMAEQPGTGLGGSPARLVVALDEHEAGLVAGSSGPSGATAGFVVALRPASDRSPRRP
jgi:hypothetical protein